MYARKRNQNSATDQLMNAYSSLSNTEVLESMNCENKLIKNIAALGFNKLVKKPCIKAAVELIWLADLVYSKSSEEALL